MIVFAFCMVMASVSADICGNFNPQRCANHGQVLIEDLDKPCGKNPCNRRKCCVDLPTCQVASDGGIFDSAHCKGGIEYFDGTQTCNDQLDCAEKCCDYGACIPGGPPCDSSKYHCTCDPGPYRRNLRADEPIEILRVHGNYGMTIRSLRKLEENFS